MATNNLLKEESMTSSPEGGISVAADLSPEAGWSGFLRNKGIWIGGLVAPMSIINLPSPS